MPREKTIPVKRKSDRFHVDDIQPSLDEEIVDLSEHEDSNEVSVENETIDIQVSDHNTQKIRLDCSINDFDSKIWFCIGAKQVDDRITTNTVTSQVFFRLETYNSNENIDFFLGYIEKSIGIALQKAITNKIIGFKLNTYNFESSEEHTTHKILYIYLTRSITSIQPLLLRWILLDTIESTHQKVFIEEKFNATDFLDTVTNSTSGTGSSTIAVSPTLVDILKKGGIRTDLREYQLQGVQWMSDFIGNKGNSKECMGDKGNSSESIEEYMLSWGWYRIPERQTESRTYAHVLTHDDGGSSSGCSSGSNHTNNCSKTNYNSSNKHSSSDTSSNSTTVTSSTEKCLWYSLLTGDVVFDTLPILPPASSVTTTSIAGADSSSNSTGSDNSSTITRATTTIPIEADTTEEKGLILADEMGVGKSLQVIALIVLLKQQQKQQQEQQQILPPLLEEQNDVFVQLDPTNCTIDPSNCTIDPTDCTIDPTNCTIDPTIENATNTTHYAENDTISTHMHTKSTCLCGSNKELNKKEKKELGWIQCNSCNTWLHSPCAGFTTVDSINQCDIYICLYCSSIKYFTSPLRSSTTLLIMPNTLINQWKLEFIKHCSGNVEIYDAYNCIDSRSDSSSSSDNNISSSDGSSSGSSDKNNSSSTSNNTNTNTITNSNSSTNNNLKVFIYPEYNENNKTKIKNYSAIDPRELIKYDVILLSFHTLKNGFYNTNIDYNNTRIIKNSNNIIYPPSYLCIHYNLCILDETQNIETSTINSHIMNMVCKIHSNNRICVSGTPFGHNKLYDIYNLLKFLYIQPISYQFYWNNIIYKPILYIPLQKRLNILYFLFKNRILRRTKQKIKKELDLPELQIVKQTLTFSTFEVFLSFL